MMNFFTKLLTPVFIALGMVNPTPVVETPTLDIQVQQELIELRQKVQEFESQNELEMETEIQEVEENVIETNPVIEKVVVKEVIVDVPVEVAKEVSVVEPIVEEVVELDTSKQDKFNERFLDKKKDALNELAELHGEGLLLANPLNNAIDSKYISSECRDLLDDVSSKKWSPPVYGKYLTLKNECTEIEYPDGRYKIAEDNLIENKLYEYKSKVIETADSIFNDDLREEADAWGVKPDKLLITINDFK